MGPSFEAVLPGLLAAFERGRLVPFLGAGMSFDRCVLWPELVTSLERHAFGAEQPGAAVKEAQKSDSQELVRRAHTAVFRLKLAGGESFREAIKQSLIGASQVMPNQTARLAEIFWPLVLTTNYDDLFLAAWNQSKKHGSRMQVLGRSPEDCRRVLASLYKSRPPILWALQGHLPGQFQPSSWQKFGAWFQKALDPEETRVMRRQLAREADDSNLHPGLVGLFNRPAWVAINARRRAREEELEKQLVVGHAEYRQVAFAEPHFRRVFAEVFRTRSFLFLGSSLADQYLLDLFGEVLELFGTNPFPHYALVKEGEVDADFLRMRLNTIAVEYRDHQELPGKLLQLREAIETRSARVKTWSYSMGGSAKGSDAPPVLHLVRGGLSSPREGECVVLRTTWTSEGRPQLDESSTTILRSLAPPAKLAEARRPEKDHFISSLSSQVFLLDAEALSKRRPGHGVARAFGELLNAAEAMGFRLVRIPIPSGNVPARFFLMWAIGAYGRWLRQRAVAPDLGLAIHVEDPGVLFDLQTGRIDPGELLLNDEVRIAVEILGERGEAAVELVQYPPDRKVVEIGDSFGIPRQNWLVEIDPSPDGQSYPLALTRLTDTPERPAPTLADLGAIMDSTLRFLYVTPATRPEAERPSTPAAAAKPVPAGLGKKETARGTSKTAAATSPTGGKGERKK